MERVIIKIYGLVQGVFFRQEAKKKAEELGLVGYAKNNSDGSVTIVVEGEKEKLEKLIEWVKTGPDLARVDRVEVEWEKGTGKFHNFSINY